MVSGVCGEVLEASTGREVMDQLEELEVDVVVMDLRMPHLNGIQAARLIKADADLQRIKIIMVSASIESEVMKEATEAGCEAFITKPVKLTELLGILCRLFPAEQGEGPITPRDKVPEKQRSAPAMVVPEMAPEVWQAIDNAAGIGDIGLIREVLDELQANPENQPFIERVNSYLDDFELMALQQFLAECQRDEAESWQNS